MMLAPSSPEAQPGLSTRDLLVGCVAGNDPRSLAHALRLVQSIRWFGGELADVPVRIAVRGEADPAFRQALTAYGAEVGPLDPAGAGPLPGPQLLPRETGRGTLLLLDGGTLVVRDPLPALRSYRPGAPLTVEDVPAELDFQTLLADHPPPEGTFAVDPAILRYGDRVDAEGYLLGSPYPLAQVRIEAFNRRLRRERERLAGQARAPWPRPVPAAVPAAGPAAQVVVLGMHRSGTSALTHLLRRMGLWAGEEDDFAPGDEHNPDGYWEHRGVWAVDEAVLESLGATWAEIADLDLGRLGEGVRTRFRERAREIAAQLDRAGSWVVKDPRLCVLFPLWREVLARPFCVLVHRAPLPIARSLAKRDGLPIPCGIALWEAYTRQALAATRGLPRALVAHRELLADPETTLRRLHGEMARQRPELAGLRVPSVEEIREVLDPALVHHRPEPESERQYLNLPQLELLQALDGGTALDLDPVPLSAGARDLIAGWQGLQAAQRGLRHQLAVETQAAAGSRADNEGLRRRLQQQAETAAVLQEANQDLRRHLDLQTATAAGLQEANSGLRRDLAQQAETAVGLQEALWGLDEIVSALLDSRAWKIGSAVTGVRRLFGRAGTSAAERRERLMGELRKRQRPTAAGQRAEDGEGGASSGH